MLQNPILIPLGLAAFILYCLSRRRRLPPGTRLPPGPKRLPVVGNLFNVPHEHPWLKYADWNATYGDVVYMEVFGSPVVVLNSVKATTELFEKRSANYSDRPSMVNSKPFFDRAIQLICNKGHG